MSTENSSSVSTPLVEGQPPATPPTTSATPTNPPSLIAPQSEIPPAPAAEWKEYTVDPNLTDAENAAKKADHDATKPAPAAPPAEIKPIAAADIKLPEGAQVDEPTMNEFLGFINDPKMTKSELAQKLVDLQLKSTNEAFERASQHWETTMANWQEEVRNDPEIGGAKFDQSVATANKVIQQHGSPELAELCAQTGIGNNKHFVKFLTAIAPKLTEPAPVQAGAPIGGSTQEVAERMFPTMKK